MAQLPVGAEGAAAAVMVWASICFSANVLLLWLLWSVRERRSYLFIVSCVSLLATTTSIIQQIYTIIYYQDLAYDQLELAQKNPDDPFVQVTMGASGLCLVLWEMRWACYIAEAGIAFFWAFSLTQSVYGWRDDLRLRHILHSVNEAGKVLPLVGAALTLAVFQAPAVQTSFFWMTFVMNLFYMASCAGAVLMFILIAIEFLQTRRLLRRMNSQQRHDFLHQPPATANHARSASTQPSFASVGRVHTGTEQPFGTLQQQQGGINDNYLIVRTIIPTIALFLFEIDNILANDTHPTTIHQIASHSTPNLSAATARTLITNFIPGCLASLVLFLAFATTRQLLEHLRSSAVAMPSRLLFHQSSHHNNNNNKRQQSYRASPRYVAMDHDGGMLSRQKRLSMEKRLRIEVTYEFEVRNEELRNNNDSSSSKSDNNSNGEMSASSAAASDGTARAESATEMRFLNKGSAIYPYNVDSHHWDDTEHILPKKPNTPVLMRHGLLMDGDD